MNDIISIYLEKSKLNLISIINSLENEIEFNQYNLYSKKEEFNDILNNVVKIYYDNYYLNINYDYSIINKYIKFSKTINIKLKKILMSIIDYYVSLNKQNIIKEYEPDILFLTILIYLADYLYNINYELISNNKLLEKHINNVIDNFANIKFKKERNLDNISNLLKIKTNYNNNFDKQLTNLEDIELHNCFTKVNKNNDIYVVMYEYDFPELKQYNKRDIKNVLTTTNIYNTLFEISLNNLKYTIFNTIKNNNNAIFLYNFNNLEINNNSLNILNKVFANKYLKEHLKIILDYNKIANNYDLLNIIEESNNEVYIDVKETFETKNYNMFMNINNIIINEDFITINSKYVEIWKDMNINFMIKDLGQKVNSKELLGGK